MNSLCFLAFGIAMLLPYNSLIAAIDFFITRLPNYEPSFSFLLALSASMCTMQAACFFILNSLPLKIRITLSLIVNALVTIGLGIVPLEIENETLAYILSVILVFIFGIFVAILQSTLYSIAGPS